MEAAKAAEMRARKERRVEEERRTLLKHLELQDGRLKQRTMMKQAAREKRIAEAFDPTPVRRKMYDDQMLEVAAQVPGPGTYVPGFGDKKESIGKTFGPAPGLSKTSSVIEINGTPGYDMSNTETWKLLQASRQPGPSTYSPLRPRHAAGTTFGLPPEQLKGGKESIPSAHDMGKMVSHLKGLPGPGAHSPRLPEKSRGFHMRPSKALSTLEKAMEASAKIPGPGTYDLDEGLAAGHSYSLAGRAGGTTADQAMEISRHVPGPGAYKHYSQLKMYGSPAWGQNAQPSLIETIQRESRVSVCTNALPVCPVLHTLTCSPSVHCNNRPSPAPAHTIRRQPLRRSSRRSATCAALREARRAQREAASSRHCRHESDVTMCQ
jgi:hypothetical protein